MRRYTKSKGQWFLISAVLISYAILTISSSMFSFSQKRYYWDLLNDGGSVIENVERYLNDTTKLYKTTADIDESLYFLERELKSRGMDVNITYEVNGNEVIYHVNISSSDFSIFRTFVFS